MRFLLNNLTAVRRKTGIGHYVAELVRCLRENYHEHQFDTFPGRWVETGVRAWGRIVQVAGFGRKRPASANTEPRLFQRWINTFARDWAAWQFRNFWRDKSYTLYHEPNYIPLEFDGPTIATVHDLSVVLHPEWHPSDRVRYYSAHFEAGLGRCRHLLVPSEFTRRELIKNYGVPCKKITCTPLGMRANLRVMNESECRPVLKRLGLPDSYLLHVGTIEPRKNLLVLMRAYCDLPSETRDRCPLVLVGGWGWNVTEIAGYFNETGRHRGVRHLGYVPDADLAALYSAARTLVFPSHYEGFGLPPLEMLACGGAVIASTAGAVVETVGNHAYLVEAQDLEGWREGMRRAITDDNWLNSLRRGGPDVARACTWQRCAEDTFEVYRQVLGMPSSKSTSVRISA